MDEKNNKIRIGILRGGVNDDFYTYSIKEGGNLISFFNTNLSDKFDFVDIFIDKNNIWHVRGLPIEIKSLKDKVDIVWNKSHHSYNSSFEELSIPVINTGSRFHFLTKEHHKFRDYLNKSGFATPRFILLQPYQEDIDGSFDDFIQKKAKLVFEKFSSPWIIKSFNRNKNIGIHFAKTFPELTNSLKDIFSHNESVLVEEFIEGKNISLSVIKGFRGQEIYMFPPTENTKDKSFFIARFSDEKQKKELYRIAEELYKKLETNHYIRIDFVLHNKKGIFVLDINDSLDLKEGMHLDKSCEYIGTKLNSLVEHIVKSN